jgi:polyhydroxyalkanoate synthesis regulator phasin
VTAGTTAVVQAQDADVVNRLGQHGGLSRREARSLVKDISKKMQKAADSFVGMNDPIRKAMRIAMFGAQSSGPQQDAVNDAKARLYLYGGLNARTLALLFKPGPVAVSGCTTNFKLTKSRCESLVAAAGKRPVSQIRSGQGAPAMPSRTYGATPTTAAPTPTARPTAYPTRPAATRYPTAQRRPMAAPGRPATMTPAPRRPMVTPAPRRPVTVTPAPRQPTVTHAPRPTAAPARPVRRGPNAATAAAYKARRARQLAKYKKKDKPEETTTEAAPEPAAAPAAAAPAPEAKAEAKAKAKPKAKPKPKEPDSLIDGLLSDPLGKSD